MLFGPGVMLEADGVRSQYSSLSSTLGTGSVWSRLVEFRADRAC